LIARFHTFGGFGVVLLNCRGCVSVILIGTRSYVTGPVTTLQQVHAETAAKQTDTIRFLNNTKDTSVPPLCKFGDAKRVVTVPIACAPAIVIVDSTLRATMPMFGPVRLPYNDVHDISMYSKEEIDNESDCLEMYVGIEYEYAAQLKSNSRRNVAGAWMNCT